MNRYFCSVCEKWRDEDEVERTNGIAVCAICGGLLGAGIGKGVGVADAKCGAIYKEESLCKPTFLQRKELASRLITSREFCDLVKRFGGFAQLDVVQKENWETIAVKIKF